MKDADVCIHRKAQLLPQVVVECGYADCPDHLNDDLILWFKGASQPIPVIIIVVWKGLTESKVAEHTLSTDMLSRGKSPIKNEW